MSSLWYAGFGFKREFWDIAPTPHLDIVVLGKAFRDFVIGDVGDAMEVGDLAVQEIAKKKILRKPGSAEFLQTLY